ncbi:MAG: metallophosphoesterase [Tepidisphaeraceae bacterium]
MHLVVFTITFFVCLDGLVWVRFHKLLRPLRRCRLWQGLLALAMVALIAFAAALATGSSTVLRTHRLIPQWISSTVFVWHFLVLPMTIAVLGAELGFRLIRGTHRPPQADRPTPPPPAAPLMSRRRFLTAAAFAAPPLASVTLGGIGVAQLGKFRIKRYELALKGFPPGLDGFTIALVADVHAGVFSTQKMLDDIAEATNSLRPELILLGGDLVNISHSDLPSALDMVNRLSAPCGPYMIQGNHDVMGGAEQFNDACAARDVPLLLNQAQTIYPRGIPIQLLGIIWTDHGAPQHEAVNSVLQQRDPALFPILLAHHPHAWDLAAANGVRLVLAGHTHGGQIMLSRHIGAGPLRFRYWTGLYHNRDLGSKLIVSNGVGDWFPLRVNAPAEIVHITLHPDPIDT